VECKSKGRTERVGLYLMVVIILSNSCQINNNTEYLENRTLKIYERVLRLESKIDSLLTIQAKETSNDK